MTTNSLPYGGATPLLLRKASVCAKQAGLSVEMLVTSCEAGDIPCEVIKLGARRFPYLRALQFDAWVNAGQPAKNLFA